MDQTDAFLATTLPRLRQADTALHNGEAGPRIAMWSHDDPVTLLGVAIGGSGWTEIEPIFQHLLGAKQLIEEFAPVETAQRAVLPPVRLDAYSLRRQCLQVPPVEIVFGRGTAGCLALETD